MKSFLAALITVLATSNCFAWFGSTKYSLSDLGQKIEIKGTDLSCSSSSWDRSTISLASLKVAKGPSVDLQFNANEIDCEDFAKEIAKHDGNLIVELVGANDNERTEVVRELTDHMPDNRGFPYYRFYGVYNKYQELEVKFTIKKLTYKVNIKNYLKVNSTGTLYGAYSFI